MVADEAIKKLETSNQGLQVISDNPDEQHKSNHADPKLGGMVDDLGTISCISENLDEKQ